MMPVDPMFFHSIVAIVIIAILGLLVGSFLNVVIYRLPIMMERSEQRYARAVVDGIDPSDVEEERFNLLFPASACPHCGQAIRAWQNIPVVSYLWQRGRCAACREPISPRYLMVEVLTMLLSILVVLRYPEPASLAFALLFTWALVALVFIDAEHQILPDVITLPLMWLGILAGIYAVFVPLKISVVGAMVGYLSLWSVYWLFKLITGREGMGYGDFKLLAALCAFQGAFMLPLILLGAAVCGLIFSLFIRLGWGKPLAFGPFLAAAGWLMFMYGGVLEALFYGPY